LKPLITIGFPWLRSRLPTGMLVTVLLAQPVYSADETAISYYGEAVTHIDNGDYKSALIELKNALQLDSRYLPARLLLGETYLNTGQGEAAEKELLTALDLGAAKDQILNPLANAYLIQRKYQEILDNIDITTSPFRNRVDLITLHGRAHFELVEYQEAKNLFDRALGIDPVAVGPLVGKANLLITETNLAEAEKLIDSALETSPNYAEAWYLKGQVRAAQNDLPSAYTAYDKVFETAPSHARARLARAELYLLERKFQQSLDDVTIVRQIYPLDPNAALISLRANVSLGNLEQAKQDKQTAIDILNRIDPKFLENQPGLARTAALIHLLNGELVQAERQLQKLLVIKPDDREAKLFLAQLYMQRGDADAAIKLLYSVYMVNRSDVEVLYLLGDSYLQQGRYVQAYNMLEEAAQ